MITKTISIITLVLALVTVKVHAADTLVVIFNKQQFVQGDSVEMEVYAEPFKANRPAQTLHVWIDNIKTGQRWKFRYPFLKGRYTCSFKINDSIPNGSYAVNFLLQDQFLVVKGKIKNATDEKGINYIATTKNKAPIIDGTAVEKDGSFKINNLIYTDSVYFSFSPEGKSKENKLKIAIEMPLDSAFTAAAVATEFITVGPDADAAAVAPTYSFTATSKKDKEWLQEVVLKTKEKSKREKFENENVSALFSSDNAKTIDFYESDELMNYPDIYSYLTANVAGLSSYTDEQTGKTILYWRKERVNIYVDEFLDVDFSPISLTMQEIEMVKIFSPGSRLGLDGFGGTVAIYTRRRSSRPGNRLSNYSFYVKGYTQKNSEWK